MNRLRTAIVLLMILAIAAVCGCARRHMASMPAAPPQEPGRSEETAAAQPPEVPKATVRVLVPCGLASSFRDISLQIPEDMLDISFRTRVLPVVEMTDKVLAEEIGGDVFASLGYKEIERLQEAGKLVEGSVRNIARFRLALIAGRGNPHGIARLEDLTKPAVKHVTMPPPHENSVGYYTQGVLRKAGLWDKLEPKLVYPEDSAQVIKYMREGWADAAVVYDTCLIETYTPTGDPKGTEGVVDKIGMIDPALYPTMHAPAGILTTATDVDAANRVIEYLMSDRVAAITARYGYLPAEEGGAPPETTAERAGPR